MQQIDSLYEALEDDDRKLFVSLFAAKYREVYGDRDDIEEMAELFVLKLLSEPNENTHYTFETEALRKRDRAKEAVLAEPTKVQKMIQMDKAIRQWSQMAGWYADFTSQGAEIQALKDSGVKKVRRHEKNDERTCHECRAKDGEVYSIDNIPPLDHLRCRRWFTGA